MSALVAVDVAMVEPSYYDEEIMPLTEPGERVPALGIGADGLALE